VFPLVGAISPNERLILAGNLNGHVDKGIPECTVVLRLADEILRARQF